MANEMENANNMSTEKDSLKRKTATGTIGGTVDKIRKNAKGSGILPAISLLLLSSKNAAAYLSPEEYLTLIKAAINTLLLIICTTALIFDLANSDKSDRKTIASLKAFITELIITFITELIITLISIGIPLAFILYWNMTISPLALILVALFAVPIWIWLNGLYLRKYHSLELKRSVKNITDLSVEFYGTLLILAVSTSKPLANDSVLGVLLNSANLASWVFIFVFSLAPFMLNFRRTKSLFDKTETEPALSEVGAGAEIKEPPKNTKTLESTDNEASGAPEN
ncbi:hypothetical protein ACUH9Y_00285 [Dermabacteraceae bacterium P13115]